MTKVEKNWHKWKMICPLVCKQMYISANLTWRKINYLFALLYSKPMSTFFYEDGLDNLYNERGQKVNDPLEGILTDVSHPNIVLKNITNREKYLSAKSFEKSCEPTLTKKQSKHEELRKVTSYKN